MTAPEPSYIVITQQIDTWDGRREFAWDGLRHATHEAAITAGWSTYGHDDFNIGRVQDGDLVWFGWMFNEVDHERAEVARQLGLGAGIPDDPPF